LTNHNQLHIFELAFVQKQLACLALSGMNQTKLWHLPHFDEYVTTDFQHGITVWEIDRLLWTVTRLRNLKSHDDMVTGFLEVTLIYKDLPAEFQGIVLYGRPSSTVRKG
jgi:hypothetical protein